MQQQDYQRVADYLKEAEKTSAKFWVACNQTMQRYVETASQGMEKVSAASQTGTDVLNANRQVMEELGKDWQILRPARIRLYRPWKRCADF